MLAHLILDRLLLPVDYVDVQIALLKDLQSHVRDEADHVAPKDYPVVPIAVGLVFLRGKEGEYFDLELEEDKQVPCHQEQVEKNPEGVGFHQPEEKVQRSLAAVVRGVKALGILLAPARLRSPE